MIDDQLIDNVGSGSMEGSNAKQSESESMGSF
jgi:hypothetical protein